MNKHEQARGCGDPEQDRSVFDGADRNEITQGGDDKLEAEHCGDRAIDQPNAVLALAARGRQAIDQANPHEIARRLGISGQGISGQDGIEPGPARRDREAREQQALVLLAAGAQAPDQQAEERRRAKRMAPEGDQRLHYTPAVNSTDMRRVSLNFTNK